MKKTGIADKKIRQQVKDFIEEALTATIASYREYMGGTMEDEDRARFEKNHKAGTIALSHIETLMELAAVAHIPDTDGDGMELAHLLQEASAEIDKYNDHVEGE
jgi:hypothetical protein